jgi:hypothetical protein
MSVKDTARGALGGAVAQRLGGERPGVVRAAAGAMVAGGVTGVVVFRLLRRSGDED